MIVQSGNAGLLVPPGLLVSRRSSVRARSVLIAATSVGQVAVQDRSRIAIGFGVSINGFRFWPRSDVSAAPAAFNLAIGFEVTTGTSSGHKFVWLNGLDGWPAFADWFVANDSADEMRLSVLEVLLDRGFWDSYCEPLTRQPGGAISNGR